MEKNINNFDVFLTFDVDYVNYVNEYKINEFEIIEDIILPYLEKEKIKATWFVRVDKKIENDFETPDYLFVKYKNIVERLKKLGHLIAWHPHSYIYDNGKWVQNLDEELILEELNYLLPFVKKYDLDIVRTGWGYQTNKIMSLFNDNGFRIDSSCMARPKYKWDMTVKDWKISSNKVYFPSKQDYRIENNDNLTILEIPITTVDMPVGTDTESVKRYINLSFYNHIIKEPLEQWIKNENFLVTIMHPYEIFESEKKHHIISFNLEEFKRNIECIKKISSNKSSNIKFQTLDWML